MNDTFLLKSEKFLYGLATDKYRGFVPGVIKVFLSVLSFFYGLGVGILILFYRLSPRRMNCKVISVGNITLGGTGKTTVVEYIARYLKGQGHKVAVLTRGYKRKFTSYELRVTSYDNMGDEPYMLSQKLGDVPVIVDADRIRGAKRALKDHGVDTVILDDGFAQWKIKKDLEIVTIDATDPFGNQRLIPRGILREPLNSLARADIFILTKANLNPDIGDIKDYLMRINKRCQVFEAMHLSAGLYDLGKPEELIGIDILKAKNAVLFCGIGDPESFESLAASSGINIGLSFKFADHHNYSQADLDKIAAAAKEKSIDILITTEKDAARLGGLRKVSAARILVLGIRLEIKHREEFYDRLLRIYSA